MLTQPFFLRIKMNHTNATLYPRLYPSLTFDYILQLCSRLTLDFIKFNQNCDCRNKDLYLTFIFPLPENKLYLQSYEGSV